MVWKPAKGLGIIVGLLFAITIIGIDIFLVRGMIGREIDLNLYISALIFILSLPVLGLWAYWYYSLLTLRYTLDRNALTIVCGFSRHIVPMEAIKRIVTGKEVTIAEGLRGFGWPGFLMGYLRLKDLGLLLVYSTEVIERQLVVVTDSICYGISPRDAQLFMADYTTRRTLEPIRTLEQTVEYAPIALLPIWRDRWFWGMILLAFVANIILFGVVARAYGGLPERIPLYFDVQGRISRIAPKIGLLIIPSIGAMTLATNGLLAFFLHRRERLGAYLLAGMALAIQLVLWLATLSVLKR